MNNKGEGWGVLKRKGGLINCLPLERGGLLEKGGLFERGRLNRGFTVYQKFMYKSESRARTTVTLVTRLTSVRLRTDQKKIALGAKAKPLQGLSVKQKLSSC